MHLTASALGCLLPGLASSSWTHGWDSTAAMTFADFNSNNLLTDAQVAFAVDKYKIIRY
jgi:hypothetical protein